MNRMSRHHAPFQLQLHHRINPIVIIIAIAAIIFVGYFLFSNEEAPVGHQTSDVKVNQQNPNPQQRKSKRIKKPQTKSISKLRRSQRLRKLNLVKVQKILSSSHLSIHQKSNLIKTYRKLSPNQQRHILNLINQSQRHFKNSQAKLRILESYLKLKAHNITSDLNRKRL